MTSNHQAEKIHWHRNIAIDDKHMVDVFINPVDRFVVIEIFTPFTPRIIAFACVYEQPCNYLEKAIAKAAQLKYRYDEWCRKGMISDNYR